MEAELFEQHTDDACYRIAHAELLVLGFAVVVVIAIAACMLLL